MSTGLHDISLSTGLHDSANLNAENISRSISQGIQASVIDSEEYVCCVWLFVCVTCMDHIVCVCECACIACYNFVNEVLNTRAHMYRDPVSKWSVPPGLGRGNPSSLQESLIDSESTSLLVLCT